MKRITFVVALIFAVMVAAPALAQSPEFGEKDVDLEAADGTNLKATYTSPSRPGGSFVFGPAMLLIHQCNMDRHSWNDISSSLVQAGVHVLTMDLRGFGDSGGEPLSSAGFQNLMMKSPADLDMAYEYLTSQAGVDDSRVAVGGASCGAMLTADLASRHDGITTLMLLSGPPSEAAVAHIASTPDLAVFAAAATGDTITPGVSDALKGAVDGSKHPKSMAKIYGGTEHGLPMFEKNPDLQPALLSWLKGQLLSN